MPPHTRTHVRNTGCREQTEVEIDVPIKTIENYVAGRSNEEQKQKRGPTYMCSVWGYHATQHGGERLVANFNKYGQPIGQNKSLFVEFLGTIAWNGKHAPIDIKSWDKMPKSLKENMLELVQEKFEIPRGSDIWVLQSIGKKWRNWKADCISERNKKSRLKKSLMHITGKRSFGQVREDQEKSIGHSPTRIEMFEKYYTKEGITNSIEASEAVEKMKEIRSQTSQTTDVGRDDIFSKVLGNDKVGRVRMYGFGVTPYVAWGEITTRSSAYRLIESYKEAFEKMEKQVHEQGEVIAKMKLDMQSTQQACHSTPLRTAQYSQNGDVHSLNNSALIQVGTKVAVKSVLDSTKTVAIGYVQSMDPAHRVGNYPLGPNWCLVHINIPVNWEEHLIRPYSTLTTIGQAIGTYVAWPQALVVREED
ncbi:hypothetical protein M5K25_009148 [Dendrobium thyrsiflorum]|uniref:Transposase Tnp1/En/Spm-like domain-containing protein n=1 Tax=Dendrobium thyrsiflorum TaxID=117978 RepID=A0ABD0V4S0_DENTH